MRRDAAILTDAALRGAAAQDEEAGDVVAPLPSVSGNGHSNGHAAAGPGNGAEGGDRAGFATVPPKQGSGGGSSGVLVVVPTS